MANVRTMPLTTRLDRLTNADLVHVYNSVSALKVSKFSDHSTAVARTEKVLTTAGRDFTLVDGVVTIWSPEARPMDNGDMRTITILSKGNPKQLRSKSHARFELYRNGMTVGQYVRAVGELGRKRRVAIRDIFWDIEHEHISLTDPVAK